ncbi:MAG: hypothetical protein NT062_04780, partial [Proteobacteria bacterium]|nr:hypothetical protein [Pseudomonadota bacterium]
MTRSLVLSLVSLLSLDAHADRVGPQAGARAPRPSRIEQEPMDPPVQPTPVARPAPETAATGKALTGTWQCKGVTLAADGSSTPIVS